MNWNHSLPYFSRTAKSSTTVRALFTTAIIFLALAGAHAQQHYRLDPAKSEVHFTLDATGHAVEGTFKVGSGDVTFNTADGTMGGTISVDATSGNSENKSRDKKMTADQLKAGQFPLVTFAPGKYSGTLNTSGDSSIQVEGAFTLLGQAHSITVPMSVHCAGGQCAANGSFTVPFVQWGVKDPSVMFLKVAKEVKIELKLNGTIGQ